MKRPQVYALGRDRYWLEAVGGIVSEGIVVRLIECPGGYPECLDHLPTADPRALLLVDATSQTNVEAVTRRLRKQGWQYVIVVAADPSSNEARAVLKGGIAYDYWEKSYVSELIRRDVERCLYEIQIREE